MNTLFGLERMVPFTAEVLASLHAGMNADLWLLRWFGIALSVGIAWRVWFHRSVDDRITASVLAAFWLWNGLGYMGLYRAELDWAAKGYGLVFVIQGGLLTWMGAVRGQIKFNHAGRSVRMVGLALVLFAICGYPLIVWLMTGNHEAVATVGLLPSPTTVLMLGVLVMAGPGAPRVLFLLPVLWSVIGGALAWVLGTWHDLCLPAAALLALISLYCFRLPAEDRCAATDGDTI